MSARFAFHPDALADLEDLHDYIAQESPTAADRVTGEILNAVDSLVSFPHQGHQRPDLTSRPLRFTVVREPDCLCSGAEAAVGRRGTARNPHIIAAILSGR